MQTGIYCTVKLVYTVSRTRRYAFLDSATFHTFSLQFPAQMESSERKS